MKPPIKPVIVEQSNSRVVGGEQVVLEVGGDHQPKVEFHPLLMPRKWTPPPPMIKHQILFELQVFLRITKYFHLSTTTTITMTKRQILFT